MKETQELSAFKVKPSHETHGIFQPFFLANRSFWGMTVTQFLGAFNDNVFKQLLLLLAIPVAASSMTSEDMQGQATMVFSLPFILFSGLGGFLSERFSKRRIIILCKVAEVAVMLLGMAAFFYSGVFGFAGLMVVLFLMGTQSAFFGPAKYGILPEIVRKQDLVLVNGWILMTTFAAIIFGTAAAGLWGNIDPQKLWMGSIVCVGIAVLGTITSVIVRPLPPANRGLKFHPLAVLVPPDVIRLLVADRPLVAALAASSMFWMAGNIALLTVNSLGMVQLQLGPEKTSLLTASIGLGICFGSLMCGVMCKFLRNRTVVQIGGLGMICLAVPLSLSRPDGEHLLGYPGSFPALVLLGVSAGVFAIPLQTFLQIRPPKGSKGRMMAVMNQVNFAAILVSGALYTLFDQVVDFFSLPRSAIFAMIAVLLVPVALFYRLEDNG